jgi:hypothetical protein
MRHIIRAVVMVLGAGFGCATAPVIIEPGPGHPASTMEPEAPRPAATLTLKAESIPSVLDHAPKGGAASRETTPATRPEGGHQHRGHGHGGGS